MRCSIMQPTFFPWAGYFRLMAEADKFVFLDTVQLSHQSWQTRNRILLNGAVHWIVAPVRHDSEKKKINEVALADERRWRKKLARTLREGYGRHPFGAEIADLISILETSQISSIDELNIAVITHSAERLSISTPCARSSSLPLSTMDRTDRLVEICRILDCNEYLSPAGAADYLAHDNFVGRSDIRLMFANYRPPAYPQRKTEKFVSHLSIIDVVANLGWRGAKEYIFTDWK